VRLSCSSGSRQQRAIGWGDESTWPAAQVPW
jgi:hypothetical protein